MAKRHPPVGVCTPASPLTYPYPLEPHLIDIGYIVSKLVHRTSRMAPICELAGVFRRVLYIDVHQIPLRDLLECMDLRAVQTVIIRKGGALGDSEEEIIDDTIETFPATTTFGLDVYRLRRHALYPYFACSGFQTAKVWDREEDCLSPAEERAAIEVDTKMAQSLLRSSTLTTLDDTQDLSIKSCPSVLWPSLRRISAPLLTALHLYGPDVLSVRRLPPTASLDWVTHVPALRDLELHSVGLDERSLIQLLAGVASVERMEITQHPCVQWTHNSNQSVIPGPPYHCHPIGAEVCAGLAVGRLLPNAKFVRFGEGSWGEDNLAELRDLVEARGQHLRSAGFGHSSAIRLRVSSSRCSRHQKEDRYIGIRDILGDEVWEPHPGHGPWIYCTLCVAQTPALVLDKTYIADLRTAHMF